MKKRKLSLLLALAMMLFTVGGCANSDSDSVSGEASVSESAAESVAEDTTDESSEADETTTTTTAAETETTETETASAETENTETDVSADADTPFGRHGKLSVDGAYLVDESGEKYQLYGMSTHGIAWYPQYISTASFATLRDGWNTNCVRLSMYTYESGGYCTDGDQEELKELVESGVEYATNLGMYVIIDWHVLNEKDPNVYKDEAIDFFTEMSTLYKDYDNVIYEICNEPNTTPSWSDVKSYAEEVIPVIRANDSDAIVIVGTPTWSQDIDKALADPLDYDNVMYALHFYADTHTDWLRQRVSTCIDSGLPVFISEFNITDSSGDSNVNTAEGDEWMKLIDEYNLSYMCWNLSKSDQECSVISSSALSGWERDDLSTTGKWVYDYFTAEDNQ